MLGAGAALQRLLWVQQLVFGIENGTLVWLHVLITVGRGAGEAGADGGLFDPRAHVAPHRLLAGRSGVRFSEGLRGPGCN